VTGSTWEISRDAFAGLNDETFEPDSGRETRLGELADGMRALLGDAMETADRGRVERIAISVPGILGQIPFEAILSEGGNTSPVTAMWPSLAVGSKMSASDSQRRGSRLLLVEYAGDDLRDVAAELDAIEGVWQGEVIRLNGREHSRLEVLAALAEEDVGAAHFSGHGTFDPLDPLASGLLLSDRGEFGTVVTARDLYDCELASSPVISLSACSTALVAPGLSNSAAGFVGGLLSAGAHCVVGTRWPVYDDAACEFFTAFYRLLGWEHPSRAVHLARLYTKERYGKIEDWEAFTYYGPLESSS
jgi:CHAT domain-containing protein